MLAAASMKRNSCVEGSWLGNCSLQEKALDDLEKERRNGRRSKGVSVYIP